MRERPRHRLSWRVGSVLRSDDAAGRANGSPANRCRGAELAPFGTTVTYPHSPPPDPLAELKADTPGPDGIRRRLVERVRQLIADGAYDTPERWAAAEERLCERIAGGR